MRCRRLPLAEHLPRALRGQSQRLDSLNLTTVMRCLVEWCACRDWPTAIARALETSQRGCGGGSGG